MNFGYKILLFVTSVLCAHKTIQCDIVNKTNQTLVLHDFKPVAMDPLEFSPGQIISLEQFQCTSCIISTFDGQYSMQIEYCERPENAETPKEQPIDMEILKKYEQSDDQKSLLKKTISHLIRDDSTDSKQAKFSRIQRIPRPPPLITQFGQYSINTRAILLSEKKEKSAQNIYTR